MIVRACVLALAATAALGATPLVSPTRPVTRLSATQVAYLTHCGGCHGIGRITGAGGKSKTDWQSTVERMMAKGLDLTPGDEAVAIAYLARYFGEEVKVNAASAKDLQEQLELSASEAEAIVTARAAAPFKSFADLAKVSGLDIKKLEPMKGRLVY